MKDICLSFPYPATSRHNLSQDVALSLSIGPLVPVRIIEVLPGDTHRIGTSFSMISNPLVKPLLQGINMRYARFWVPRRIYHADLRSNNTNYDPRTARVRTGLVDRVFFPVIRNDIDEPVYITPVAASSLFDYLGIGSVFNYFHYSGSFSSLPTTVSPLSSSLYGFNAEPYVAYLDIVRNYFADSALNKVAFLNFPSGTAAGPLYTCVCPLENLDSYIDSVQNTTANDPVNPFNYSGKLVHTPFDVTTVSHILPTSNFNMVFFGYPRLGLAVPMYRPDRYSRFFDTRPLTSQSAVINPAEISIGNFSVLSKIQRYLTRTFFGDSRFTGAMRSVFGQKVPHVDTPVLLDVFDYELGSELVASTNATESQNPGVLGGYIQASGVLTTSGSSRSRKKYRFNEAGYLIDLVYIMPRIFRNAYVQDFYPVRSVGTNSQMVQGNFIPDLNGIGWQQPAFNAYMYDTNAIPGGTVVTRPGFCCEPSWQQYRTLPDIAHGLLNYVNGQPGNSTSTSVSGVSFRYYPTLGYDGVSLNSPFFVFGDRFNGETTYLISSKSDDSSNRLNRMVYPSIDFFNQIFGIHNSNFDNIFAVFRYSHQAKRQVTKRFTLSFA
ncbi:major capsid protein [Microvirus mar46]|uniref:Major capsid protein n=1 Tax=Microvirus mar46 TaxID=2851181 RepID=A0A8F5MJR5_9VIRU|nr:major capsid protein [Microvirus mar46]